MTTNETETLTPQEAQEPQEQPQETTPQITDDDVIAALTNPSEGVKQALDALIGAAVKKALAGSTPRRSATKTDTLTREAFQRMTYKERCNLFETNRPLYDELKG